MFHLKAKAIAQDFIYDIVGAALYSIGVYSFAKAANFAPGGISGLAIMINYLFSLPIGTVTFLFNIPLFLISYKYVGKSFLLKTIKSMLICMLFLDVIFPRLPLYTGNQLLAGIYSGLFMGAGMALFYMRGSSSGGIDLLIMSIKRLRPHLSIGFLTILIDFVIIMLGWAIFGTIDSVLYAILSVGVASIVMDKILYGVGSGKMVLIITTKGQEIADAIAQEFDRGSTLFDATGSYTGENKNIVICACTKQEMYKIRSCAFHVDEKAFIMISETNEVFGEGFQSPPS